MTAKITVWAETLWLEFALNGTLPYSVHLANEPFQLADDPIPADFSEATYAGYASQTLASFSLIGADFGGKAIASFPPLTFTCADNTNPNTIYGYWVEAQNGQVFWEELFTGTPRPMIQAGQYIVLGLELRLWSPV